MKPSEEIIARAIEQVYFNMNFTKEHKKLALNFVKNSDNAITLDICNEVLKQAKEEMLKDEIGFLENLYIRKNLFLEEVMDIITKIEERLEILKDKIK